jgi:hypothetical protein
MNAKFLHGMNRAQTFATRARAHLGEGRKSVALADYNRARGAYDEALSANQLEPTDDPATERELAEDVYRKLESIRESIAEQA